jgi:hypothetical protein
MLGCTLYYIFRVSEKMYLETIEYIHINAQSQESEQVVPLEQRCVS